MDSVADRLTLNTLLIVAIEIPLNLKTSHWSHRRTMTLGAFLFAIGFGALALARTPGTVMLTVVIWTFGEMTLFPAMSAYVGELAPARRRGEYMGLYTMSFSLAFIFGPWAGTVIYEKWGSAILWSTMPGIGFLSTWMIWRITPASKKLK